MRNANSILVLILLKGGPTPVACDVIRFSCSSLRMNINYAYFNDTYHISSCFITLFLKHPNPVDTP